MEILALLTGAFGCEDAGWQKGFLLNIKSPRPFILAIFPAGVGWGITNPPPALISLVLLSGMHCFHH